MNFNKNKSSEAGLSDLLNYAHLIADGVIVNKDGAFLISYQFQGIDSYSASTSELDALAQCFNRMCGHLEDGWMLHLDELRIPSQSYTDDGFFPDRVSKLIDDERRGQYQSFGQHFENIQVLTLVWKFPAAMVKNTRHWFVEGLDKNEKTQSLTQLLEQFIITVNQCIALLSVYLKLEKLNSHELLSYLNTCISGRLLPVTPPPDDSFIDVILGRQNLIGGYIPKIGEKHIVVLSVVGYLNHETIPGLLQALGTYPITYRWSNRFIVLSELTAAREIKKYRTNWHNKVKGFKGAIVEAIFGTVTQNINQDALNMHAQSNDALTLNSNQSVRFGYWTSSIILMDEELDILNAAAKNIAAYVEQVGFAVIQEDVNGLDAWFGSIPGHGSCNVRRLFLHTLNLAHVLPLHSIWVGDAVSHPASLLPPNSPPVFYADTIGKTPFRFHLDVEDVGHQIVLGPTGSGKSTYLGFLITQFFRYENARVFVFDKDYSHQALTVALDGKHYDIGHNETLTFAPLAILENDTNKSRAAQFIEELIRLQNINVMPQHKTQIYAAIQSIAKSAKKDRTLTVLSALIQDELLRQVLRNYTIAGSQPLLDATHDSLQTGPLHTFEMNWLLAQKPEIYLPMLQHIFNHIESALDNNNTNTPTLIILEEAWFYISHDMFALKLRDWLKTLRKKNARVVFATQSLADLYDPTTQTLTKTTAAIQESCATKIYLANPYIDAEIKTLYQKMGLSARQIEIIQKEATPKRHYYVSCNNGNRLIDLDLKPDSKARAFIGLSKDKSRQLIECKQQHGDAWLEHWLSNTEITNS